MLGPVSSLNGRVFDEDPIITYMLMDMPREERLEYLPTYWYKLGKSALMNDAVITEADGWKAGAIVVPPGKHVENVWTLFSAGFLGVLWRIGFSGLKVCLSPLEDAQDESQLTLNSAFGLNSLVSPTMQRKWDSVAGRSITTSSVSARSVRTGERVSLSLTGPPRYPV